MNLKDFMKRERPLYRSKADPYREDIIKLIENGYSPKQILRYLNSYKKLDISLSNLYKYLSSLKAEMQYFKKSKDENKKDDIKESSPEIDNTENLKAKLERLKKDKKNEDNSPKYYEPKSDKKF